MALSRSLGLLTCAFVAAAAAQDEVPFITTPDHVTVAMLELAGVGAADHVIDLGSGDGRIVITAARRFGASGLGVEIVPDLVRRSRAAARAAGVAERTEFREQDLFTTDLARATVVTMYLLPEVNLQLRPRLLALAPGTRIVSHDWDLGDWRPDRRLTVDVPGKAIGREKRSTLMLWTVPAAVHGLWCAPGAQLEIVQRFQDFSATFSEPGRAAPTLVFDGELSGRRAQARPPALVRLEAGAGEIVAEGLAGAAERRRFVRAQGPSCP
jgi:SAM-dependent methyltransferase